MKGSLKLDTFNKILPTLVYDLVDPECSLLEDQHDETNDRLLPREDWKGR